MFGHGKVVVLKELTKEKTNLDYDQLDHGSHKKVFVQCLRCNEIIARERRKIEQLHHCKTRITREDGISLKWCNSCSSFLPLDLFSANNCRYDKMGSLCKSCTSQTDGHKKRRSKWSAGRTTTDGWLKWSISHKRCIAKKYGYSFEITFEDLKEIVERQHNKCYYSGFDLEFGKNSLYSASLERLDSNNGYTKDNVVVACKAMNNAKNNNGLEEFYAFLTDLATNIKRGEVQWKK